MKVSLPDIKADQPEGSANLIFFNFYGVVNGLSDDPVKRAVLFRKKQSLEGSWKLTDYLYPLMHSKIPSEDQAFLHFLKKDNDMEMLKAEMPKLLRLLVNKKNFELNIMDSVSAQLVKEVLIRYGFNQKLMSRISVIDTREKLSATDETHPLKLIFKTQIYQRLTTVQASEVNVIYVVRPQELAILQQAATEIQQEIKSSESGQYPEIRFHWIMGDSVKFINILANTIEQIEESAHRDRTDSENLPRLISVAKAEELLNKYKVQYRGLGRKTAAYLWNGGMTKTVREIESLIEKKLVMTFSFNSSYELDKELIYIDYQNFLPILNHRNERKNDVSSRLFRAKGLSATIKLIRDFEEAFAIPEAQRTPINGLDVGGVYATKFVARILILGQLFYSLFETLDFVFL